MMSGKNKMYSFNEPLLYIGLALLGLLTIIFMPDEAHVCEKYKRIVAISTDIGVAFFPTGLIGIILVFMQKSEKSNQKFKYRVSLLRDIDLCLFNFLNDIYQCASKNSDKKAKNIKHLLTQIGSGSWEMIPTNDLKESAHSFSKQVKEFLIKKTDYLLAESFSSEEMDALLLLSEHITSYIDSVDTGDDNNRGRYIIDMSSCVLKLLKAIPEFAPYLKRKFIGNRIG